MDIDGEHTYSLQLTGDTNRLIGAILIEDLAALFTNP